MQEGKSKGKKKGVAAVAAALAQPLAQEMGLRIWDVRYEKEGASWYLRVIIDKDGGVDISDCENLSRRLDKLLDEADPTEGSYILEVSSPGIERELKKPAHFAQFVGAKVAVRLIRPVEGVRDFVGTLLGCEEGTVRILLLDDVEMAFPQKEAAFVRVYEDFEAGGIQDR